MSTTASDHTTGPASPAARTDDIHAHLVRNWWLIALRGLVGVLFGLVALFFPFVTILALILLFSAYMIVDGLFSIVAAVRAARHRDRWGLLTLQGIASLATGVLAFLWPGITAFAFVVLIAASAIVSGALLIAAAFGVDGHYGDG